MKNLFNSWCKLNGITRFTIVAIVSAILLFSIIAIFEDWSLWKASEERYVALEAVANDIIENKNLSQPLSDELKNYNIAVKNDGDTEIELFGYGVENVKLVLHGDFQLKEFNRHSRLFEYIIMYFFAFVTVGLMSSTIAHGVYYLIKKIVQFIKKESRKEART